MTSPSSPSSPPSFTRPPSQARGRQRRQALLNAAVHLLTEGGFAALTHRAVAHRAHLPLAATTYYFASRDELLAQAFAQLVQTELDHLRHVVERPAQPGRHPLHALLDDAAAADRTRQLGLWELYVHAGRDPHLQHLARHWTDGCVRIVADTLHRPTTEPTTDPTTDPTARLLYAIISTLWLEHAAEQRPDSLTHAHTLLALALKNLSPPS